jgi:hypothetical protein
MKLFHRPLMVALLAISFTAATANAEPAGPGGDFPFPDDGFDSPGGDFPGDGDDGDDGFDDLPDDGGDLGFADGLTSLSGLLSDPESQPNLKGKGCSAELKKWVMRVDGLKAIASYALDEELIDDESSGLILEQLPKVPKAVSNRCKSKK